MSRGHWMVSDFSFIKSLCLAGFRFLFVLSIRMEAIFTEYYTHKKICLGHGISAPDGKWFVSDGQDPDYNPLVLLNLETGNATFLCWPNASIKGGHSQHAHVHPSLSSSGRYACYTSDVTGTAQVYVVPIPDDILNQ